MPEFDVSPDAVLSLENLRALDKIGFKKIFQNTPVARIGHERFSRNVKIAMKNREKRENVSRRPLRTSVIPDMSRSQSASGLIGNPEAKK